MNNVALFTLLSTLATSSVVALEQAVGTLNNKAEFYAREVQMDQLDAETDRLQIQANELTARVQATEECAQQGGAYDAANDVCKKYRIVQKTEIHNLIPGRTSSTHRSKIPTDQIENFKSSNNTHFNIHMRCDYGGSGTWTVDDFIPTQTYNQERQLCYRSSSWTRPSRRGYVRLQYDPTNGEFTIKPRFYKNRGTIDTASVRYSYSVIEATPIQ